MLRTTAQGFGFADKARCVSPGARHFDSICTASANFFSSNPTIIRRTFRTVVNRPANSRLSFYSVERSGIASSVCVRAKALLRKRAYSIGANCINKKSGDQVC